MGVQLGAGRLGRADTRVLDRAIVLQLCSHAMPARDHHHWHRGPVRGASADLLVHRVCGDLDHQEDTEDV